MKTRTKLIGWSALFLFVVVLFVPAVFVPAADAQPNNAVPDCRSPQEEQWQ